MKVLKIALLGLAIGGFAVGATTNDAFASNGPITGFDKANV